MRARDFKLLIAMCAIGSGCTELSGTPPMAADDDGEKSEAKQAPAAGGGGAAERPGNAAVLDDSDAGVGLDCPKGGKTSVVRVEFDCGTITTYTCKDLSNVVIEFEDGTRQRFEGQSGHVNTFQGTGPNAGKIVVRVWVKAGPNFSGDGPGYGERVEAPERDCTPPAAGSGGLGGSGGSGCENLPDQVCGPVPVSGSGGSGGAGSFGPTPI